MYFVSFIPRDAVCKRSLCCRPVSVSLFVCRSISCTVSRRLKYRQSSFSTWYVHHSGFLRPSGVTHFQGNLTSGALDTRGGKICRNRRLSRTQYEIDIWLLLKVNRKSYAVDRSVSVPVTLSDLERRDARAQISLITLIPFV